jgi:outer membrane lipase/esterase
MKRYASFLLLICLHPFPTPLALAAAFSNLYVFGDSLSDSGQYPDIFGGHLSLRATNRIDPLNPRSETARVWSQYFSQYLGLGPLLPSDPLLGTPGNNYAVVRYASDKILSSITDRFLVREPVATPRALYVVWGGGNDVLNIRNSRASGGDAAGLITASTKAADTIVTGVEALWKAGGRYILVPNLPNIGDIPESHLLGSGYISAGNDAARVFNNRLLSQLNSSGINVIQADVRSFIDEMIAHPAGFGFSTENHNFVAFDGASFTDIPAVEGVNGAGSMAPDPSRYIFFDGIHPTTYAADIISQYYLSILGAPGRISILAEIPLHLGRTHVTVIDNHLHDVQSGDRKGRFVPFIAGGYDLVSADDTDCIPGYDTRPFGLTAGFSYIVSNNWNIGAAVGYHSGNTDIEDNNGDFDMEALFLSLLTGYRYHQLALKAIFSIADLDYSDITRKLRLGPLPRTHEGETGGDYQAANISLSFDLFDRDGFTLGPVSSLSYQHIHVNGYDENGHLSTSMNFQDQHRRSLWLKAGLFASHETNLSFGQLHMRGDLGYEKECKDGHRSLRAGLITLPGSSFELPLSPPEKSYWPFNLAVGLRFATGWECHISHQLTLGGETSTGQGAQISIRTGF